eukprot:GSChrysophyteH1.ASY1.ANO1.2040.1 assembled CDS
MDESKSELDVEELTRPVGKVEEKWKLLPHFLRMLRSDADPKFFLQYTDIYAGEPSLDEDHYQLNTVTPFQCRLRDCTYSAPLYVNVRFKRAHQLVNKSGVCIGRIPIMLRSDKCVLNGKTDEELSAAQEVIIELDPKDNVSAAITSSTHDRKSRCNIFFKNNKVWLKHNSLGDDIPIVVVLKAMGLECDQEIVQLVGSEPEVVNLFSGSLEEPYTLGIMSQQHALAFIGNKVRNVRQNSINQRSAFRSKSQTPEAEAMEMLAHDYRFRNKVIYIAHIVRRVLMTVLDPTLLDDKDYYGNKRLELAGSLMSLLFEDLFKRFNSDIKRQADMVLSKPTRAGQFDVVKIMRQDTITQGFVHAISTGSWVLKRFRMDRAGVTQGEACGLVKNLALLAHVTNDEESEDDNIRKICFDLGVENASMLTGAEVNAPGTFVVFLNGLIVGLHPLQNAVYIASDGGRVCRPLLVLGPGGKLMLTQEHIENLRRDTMQLTKLEHLIAAGIIEYVDVNEENNCLIALNESAITPEHTHMEIDPLTILGVVAGLVPYPHHNQSPRNTYQCAMGKQAIGTTAMNQYERFDSLLYTMIYPQKPMVKTRTLDLINFDKVPGGQNASLAVMSYSGYDIEDAVILNRGSIDRGFGRCMRQQHLDQDGICKVGEVLEPNHVLVNRFSPPAEVPDGAESAVAPEWRKQSLSYKGAAPSTVDKVLITSNENDTFIIKALLRQVRRPEVGDKFSSRHGQKGVCGLIINQEDMPFSDRGIVPDLIMNPHGFPSRMTVGKMIELVSGKAAVFAGRQGYGSAFGEESGSADKIEDVCAELVTHGYSYVGKDSFTSGITGEPIQGFVFAGPVFYQKLKHMVMDKMHARAKGPRAVLTRQPTEGCGLMGYEGWCQRCRSGEKVSSIRLPYACKLLFQELQSMNVITRLRLQDF